MFDPQRLIPAGAGKTPMGSQVKPRSAAHPRGGGENLLLRSSSFFYSGSSPRRRGKRHRLGRVTLHARLIPAGAGKTPSKPRAISQPGAHPRVGGENDASQVTQTTGPGSSPRGRGNRVCPRAPRLVGGSSPRRRGKLRAEGQRPGREGLIPAWAGKTREARTVASLSAAHPRVGGENLSRRGDGLGGSGSSPRMRGKPRPDWSTARSTAAHPRVGGENLSGLGGVVGDPGSSPRRRGKQRSN